jgi:ribosomal protein S18 acetylase RimI-like enzyme
MTANLEHIHVRLAGLMDAEAVANLATQLGYPTTTAEARQRLEVILPLNDHAILLAQTDQQEVVGMLHVYLSRDPVSESRAEIGSLVVDAEHRSQGIGEALVESAQAWANEHSQIIIGVHCNVIRDRAHRFYERLGFKRVKSQVEFRKSLSIR